MRYILGCVDGWWLAGVLVVCFRACWVIPAHFSIYCSLGSKYTPHSATVKPWTIVHWAPKLQSPDAALSGKVGSGTIQDQPWSVRLTFMVSYWHFRFFVGRTIQSGILLVFGIANWLFAGPFLYLTHSSLVLSWPRYMWRTLHWHVCWRELMMQLAIFHFLRIRSIFSSDHIFQSYAEFALDKTWGKIKSGFPHRRSYSCLCEACEGNLCRNPETPRVKNYLGDQNILFFFHFFFWEPWTVRKKKKCIFFYEKWAEVLENA